MSSNILYNLLSNQGFINSNNIANLTSNLGFDTVEQRKIAINSLEFEAPLRRTSNIINLDIDNSTIILDYLNNLTLSPNIENSEDIVSFKFQLNQGNVNYPSLWYYQLKISDYSEKIIIDGYEYYIFNLKSWSGTDLDVIYDSLIIVTNKNGGQKIIKSNTLKQGEVINLGDGTYTTEGWQLDTNINYMTWYSLNNKIIYNVLTDQLNINSNLIRITNYSYVTSNLVNSLNYLQKNTISTTLNNYMTSNIYNNILSNELYNYNNQTLDNLIIGETNKIIINNIYNDDLYVEGVLSASNINIIGQNTIINTKIYGTTNLDIENENNITALKIIQSGYNADVASFNNSNINVLTISKNGNIGIGITNPTNTLEIIGNVKSDNIIGSGSNIIDILFNNINNIPDGLLSSNVYKEILDYYINSNDFKEIINNYIKNSSIEEINTDFGYDTLIYRENEINYVFNNITEVQTVLSNILIDYNLINNNYGLIVDGSYVGSNIFNILSDNTFIYFNCNVNNTYSLNYNKGLTYNTNYSNGIATITSIGLNEILMPMAIDTNNNIINPILWYKFSGTYDYLNDSISSNHIISTELTNVYGTNGTFTYVNQHYNNINTYPTLGSIYYNTPIYAGFKLNMPTNINFNNIQKTNGITFSIWYKTDNNGTISLFNFNVYGILGNYKFMVQGITIAWDRPSTDLLIQFILYKGNPSPYVENKVGTSTKYNSYLNKWTLITWTIDNNGNWKCYLDGILKCTLSNQDILVFFEDGTPWWNTSGYTTKREFFLGSTGGGAGSTGNITDFRIYNVVLTQEQIYSLYKFNNNPKYNLLTYTSNLYKITDNTYTYLENENPTAWYKFDNDGITIDASGNNNTLTSYNNASYSGIALKGNNSLLLNGTNQYLSGTLNLSSNSFSISAWINTNTTSNINLISFGTSNLIENSKINIGIFNSNYYFDFNDTGTTSVVPSIIDKNNWIHLTCTYNINTKTRIIYKNGIVIGLTNIINVPNVSSIFNIGNYNNSRYYNGYIDDLRIYSNVVLNSAEIKELYTGKITYSHYLSEGPLYINNISGNIGINTTNANIQFQINGIINATNVIGSGSNISNVNWTNLINIPNNITTISNNITSNIFATQTLIDKKTLSQIYISSNILQNQYCLNSNTVLEITKNYSNNIINNYNYVRSNIFNNLLLNDKDYKILDENNFTLIYNNSIISNNTFDINNITFLYYNNNYNNYIILNSNNTYNITYNNGISTIKDINNNIININNTYPLVNNSIVWYKFNNDGLINDASGNNNSLTLNNNPTFSGISLKGNDSLKLNGINQSVSSKLVDYYITSNYIYNTSNILIDSNSYINWNNTSNINISSNIYTLIYKNGNNFLTTSSSISTYPILSNLNPYLWLKFDNNYLDSSENQFVLQGSGNLSFSTTNYIIGNSSLYLNDINSYISGQSLTIDTSFSITTWIYPTNSTIVLFRYAGGVTTDSTLLLAYINNCYHFGFYNDDLISTPFVNDLNKWVNITFTYNYSNNKRYIYRNGIIIASDTSIGSLTIPNSSYIIGLHTINGSTIGWKGYINDFRIYKSVLSQTQILQLYNLNINYNNSIIYQDNSYPILSNLNPDIWYKFDTTIGESIDSSGNNNTLIIPTYSHTYPINFIKGDNSKHFNGTNQTSCQTNNFNLNSSSFNICLWIYPELIKTDTYETRFNAYNPIFSMGSGMQFEIGYNIENKYYLKFGTTTVLSTLSYNDINSWVYLTYQFDIVNKYIYIYRNGILIAQNTTTYVLNTNNYLYMAYGGTRTDIPCFYNGYMDDFRIYKGTLLTQSQILELYNGKLNVTTYVKTNNILFNINPNNFTISTWINQQNISSNMTLFSMINNNITLSSIIDNSFPIIYDSNYNIINPIVWYKFTGGTNNWLKDSAKPINDANMILNSGTFSTSSNILLTTSSCFYNAFVANRNTTNTFSSGNANGRTYSIWFNIPSNASLTGVQNSYCGENRQILFCYNLYGDYNKFFSVGITLQGNLYYYNILNPSYNVQWISPLTYKDNTWHHIVISIDKNMNFSIWIDTVIAYYKANHPENVQGNSLLLAGIGYFAGYLSDYRVYDTGIDQSQVNALYYLNKYTSNYLFNEINFGIDNNKYCLNFNDNYTNNSSINSSNDLNIWTHIACSFDLSSKTRIIYRNGDIISSNFMPINPSIEINTQYTIGCINNSNYFNGYLNDFRIFNSTLNINEIKELYTGKITNYYYNNKNNLIYINNFINNIGINCINTSNNTLEINGNTKANSIISDGYYLKYINWSNIINKPNNLNNLENNLSSNTLNIQNYINSNSFINLNSFFISSNILSKQKYINSNSIQNNLSFFISSNILNIQNFINSNSIQDNLSFLISSNILSKQNYINSNSFQDNLSFYISSNILFNKNYINSNSIEDNLSFFISSNILSKQNFINSNSFKDNLSFFISSNILSKQKFINSNSIEDNLSFFISSNILSKQNFINSNSIEDNLSFFISSNILSKQNYINSNSIEDNLSFFISSNILSKQNYINSNSIEDILRYYISINDINYQNFINSNIIDDVLINYISSNQLLNFNFINNNSIEDNLSFFINSNILSEQNYINSNSIDDLINFYISSNVLSDLNYINSNSIEDIFSLYISSNILSKQNYINNDSINDIVVFYINSNDNINNISSNTTNTYNEIQNLITNINIANSNILIIQNTLLENNITF